ncbi:MAG: RecQ family ATP-dependent DNA helicase [Bacteroidetes bacterium]|nr:RecQ family ATP-dependent DNA helicase [Bacteroidota bacterium]
MAEPHSILQQYWGYDAFRPLQEDIIRSVLEGKDTLALLPTGGGKSICYQVPALCREGICLVISPLIALMKDQVANLQKRGVPSAALYSGMSRREIDIVLENACNGAYKLLYLSPERLLTDLAQARIQRMNVNLLAVDEAHCISQWGYDFRPPYLRIAELREILPGVPVLALTATATSDVVTDIQEKLGFRKPCFFQQSFQRSNLSYSVLYESKKREKLLDILKNVPGSGIVYVRSRGEAKEISHFLQQNLINAGFYHAGLTPEERNTRQAQWVDGQMRIMVCTNAFGMGIDKPDVRIVVHLHLPESLEAYFQEAGRAGRDGKKAYATLLFAPSDADSLRYHLETAFPTIEMMSRVYQALGSYTQLAIGAGLGESFDFDLAAFCAAFKLEQGPTHAALKILEQEGWLALNDAEITMARAQVTASREAIYDYQLRQPQADTVIKVMLRAYPGINSQFLEISEALLARYANLPVENIRQVLNTAGKEGLLLYEPQKDKPQLTFTHERVAAENLRIDYQKLNWRKERAAERVRKAIEYAETLQCRSQLLLAYFGESDSKRCGICDVCTGRNKSDVSTDAFESYEKKIREILKKEALPPGEVLKAFALKRQETVAKVLAYLLDEQKLVQNEDGNLSWAE